MTGPASFGNPLSVVEAGGDEPYYRAITGTDPAIGSVFVAGEVPVGAVVQLTTADTDDILGGTRGALDRATDAFPAGAQPEAALIFSCAVRRFLLGSRTRVETELARSVLGDDDADGRHLLLSARSGRSAASTRAATSTRRS